MAASFIEITSFAAGRHFNNPDFSGTKIPSVSPPESDTVDRDIRDFVGTVNRLSHPGHGAKLVDGYAPFCKHLFVENFPNALAGVVAITDDNRHLLQSEYAARREGELAVLTRHFNAADVAVPHARFLDIILYDAAQLKKEGMPIDGQWGIVSINAVEFKAEEPMKPSTMLRNALDPLNQSGVPLDAEAYTRAVGFWAFHATVKGGE